MHELTGSLRKFELPKTDDLLLPVMEKLVVSESTDELDITALKLGKTFSTIRKNVEFHLLFQNMWNKYPNTFEQIKYIAPVEKKIMKTEIRIISRKLPWLIPFNKKVEILNNRITNFMTEMKCNNSRNLNIERSNLIYSSTMELEKWANSDELRKKVTIVYTGEAGVDQGGLRREWYSIMTRELFSTKSGLFRLTGNKICIEPSPTSYLVLDHLKYFELAGIILAKLIHEGTVADLPLSKSFLKFILKRDLQLKDLEDFSPEISKYYNELLNINVTEAAYLTFTVEHDILGQKVVTELIPGGNDTYINNQNKRHFVDLATHYFLRDSIKDQLNAFIEGFRLIFPPEFLDIFTPSEVELLISGAPEINLKEMKQYAKYRYMSAEDPLGVILWEAMEELSQKDLATFFYFVSGSMKVGYGGFKERPVSFRKIDNEKLLPVAHTCSQELDLPNYKTKEELKEKLIIAIYEGAESFNIA